MIRALQFLSDPFLVRRDEAEDRWDNRFKEATLKCERCHGTGWNYDYWVKAEHGRDEFQRCGKCQDGEIYTLLCSRCGLTENDCQCNVEDFLR